MPDTIPFAYADGQNPELAEAYREIYQETSPVPTQIFWPFGFVIQLTDM